jgi:hypothetical protein
MATTQEITERRARAARSKVKILEVLADGEPRNTIDLHTAVPSGVDLKHFSALLQRMRRDNLIARTSASDGHTPAIWTKGDAKRKPPQKRGKGSMRIARSRTDKLRAKIIETLGLAPGPVSGPQLAKLPEAAKFPFKSFEQLIWRMRQKGLLRAVKEDGVHMGYTTHPQLPKLPKANGAQHPKKMSKPQPHQESGDIGIEINEEEGSLALTLKGHRVTVRVAK